MTPRAQANTFVRQIAETWSDTKYLARLVELALDSFDGDEDAARTWFKSPHALLRNETPLEHVDTEPGARAVEDILNAIRYGFAA